MSILIEHGIVAVPASVLAEDRPKVEEVLNF